MVKIELLEASFLSLGLWYTSFMRIALVSPPISDFYFTPHRFAQLGLRQVEDFLRRHSQHTILKFPFPQMGKKGIPLPEELQYLKPFLVPGEVSPYRFFTHYQWYGPSIEKCVEAIKGARPDRILISVFAYAYAPEARELIRRLQQELPQVPIGAGGAGISPNPEYFEGIPLFPGVLGDSVQDLADFCHFSLETAYQGPSNSFPAIVGMSTPGRFSTSLSLGCPRGCSFCSNFLCHGTRLRYVEEEDLLHQLELHLPPEGGHLNFEDDNILFRREWFFSLLEKIRSLREGITFSAENGLDYTLLKGEDLAFLKEVGFSQLNFSLATKSPLVAKGQKRQLEEDHFVDLLTKARDLALPVISYFIAGLPGDSPLGIAETLLFLEKLPTAIGISPFYGVPGLPSLTKEQNQLAGENPLLCRGSSHYPWNQLSTATLVTAFRVARVMNWLKEGSQDQFSPYVKREGGFFTQVKQGKNRVKRELPGLDQDFLEAVVQ